ncbi:hypothetical protein AAGG74_18465 [Bacillus mexicanus]|uniref:hypothetical protein n=1 Tax=Bacillus mexicanus TaxID=2834415 RepID=UPI003D19188D
MFNLKKIKAETKKLIKIVMSEKRLRNIWIFGLILTCFSIFIDFKLLAVIVFVMIFLTIGALRQIEVEDLDETALLLSDKKELEALISVTKEHIETGNATLEEKIELKNLEMELNEINNILKKKYKNKDKKDVITIDQKIDNQNEIKEK